MSKTLGTVLVGVLICLWSGVAVGQGVSKEQIKGLDEQVQEIKGDVLAIAVELKQLEEKLLYPSHSEISMFMAIAEGEKFRLDSVEIRLDGEQVAHHLYSFKELEALQMGGVQRIYTGNVKTGEHDLQISFKGKSEGGSAIERSENFKVRKDIRPGVVEISLTSRGITLSDR